MWQRILSLMLLGLSSGALADVAKPPSTPIAPGIYSNEEQVYFTKEQKRPVPPLVFLRVDERLRITILDAFGKISTKQGQGIAIIAADAQGLNARLADNSFLVLRRARSATCWTAIPKKQPKADGSPDSEPPKAAAE